MNRAARILPAVLLVLLAPALAMAQDASPAPEAGTIANEPDAATTPVSTAPRDCPEETPARGDCRCGSAVITVSDDAGVWWGNRGRAYGPYIAFDRAEAPAPKPARPVFAPVYFELDESAILPQEEAKLRRVLRYLRTHPNARVRVEGNCCDLAPNAYNQQLGMRRARAVEAWLVERGIGPDRIGTVTHGEERLVTTDPGKRPLNRRADIIAQPRKR